MFSAATAPKVAALPVGSSSSRFGVSPKPVSAGVRQEGRTQVLVNAVHEGRGAYIAVTWAPPADPR